MGNVTGVDGLEEELNALTVNPDGTVPSSDTEAKTDIDAWVNQQLSPLKLNLATFIANGKKFTKLGLGQTLGTASSDTQNGYVDTIKAYLKGQLTAEAYYLWLLKTADNTPNTHYFGYAGDREATPFETVSTQLRTAENLDSNYTSVQQTMYKGGFESAIAWMVASQSSIDNTLTNLGKPTAVTVKNSLLKDGYLPSVSGLSTTDTLTGGNFNFGTDDFSNNTFASKQYIQAQAVNINTRNFNSLEIELIKATAGDFYDSLRVMVGDAFKQATNDALAGKSVALDSSSGASSDVLKTIVQNMPAQYQDAGQDPIDSNRVGLYVYAYLVAKAYLTGYRSGLDGSGPSGNGNTAINATGDVKVPSPLDLAIYSVLTGKSETYDVADSSTNPTVTSDFQQPSDVDGSDSSANADWFGDVTNSDMYDIAWAVANQAKTDFLADIQLKVNQGDVSNFNDITKVLPTATSHGMLSDAQYAYYQTHSYVYYKVFQALYNMYFMKEDSQGKPTNVIEDAVKDADEYVKQNGDSHYGHPTAENIDQAQSTYPDLKATINSSANVTLNGDVTYTSPYSGDDASTTSGLKKLTPNADSLVTAAELGNADTSATKTIQNAIDYAFVHEESMAIPAYEAGYAAVQTHLNVTPKDADPKSALADPTSDSFTFENTSTVTDTLTPVLSVQNPDKSSVWTVNYSNSDGTSTVVTIQRAVPNSSQTVGDILSMRVNVTDKNGSSLFDKTFTATKGNTVLPSVTGSYVSVQLNDNVKNDNQKQTTITVAYDNAGHLNYTFVRDAKNTVTTTVTTTGSTGVTTQDGTISGKMYQAGWDYRKSFISEITIKQQVSNTAYKDSKTGSNKLTADQIYAGFFQSEDKDGKQVQNSSVQLDPSNNVNSDYGTYAPHTINNLDGSKVVITLHVNGDVDYDIFDLANNETKGTLKAGTATITITNKDQGANDVKPSTVTISRTSNDAITVSETGVLALMQNVLNVKNDATSASAEITMGKNVVPSFTSTTIVTPVSALHTGVIFAKDTSFGTNGILSTYDTTGKTNDNGLEYQGSVANASSTDNAQDYGTVQNTTTTIQYVADNAINSGTGTTALIDTTTTTPSITISLGQNSAGVVQSTSSFATSGVITSKDDPTGKAVNVGTEIFDWNNLIGQKLPAGWTYDDTKKTLTYVPTDAAGKAALLAAIITGTYKVNWSGATDATAPALVDQYHDVMNLAINAQVKSENSLTKTIDTSDKAQVNTDYQYTFSNADIVAATQAKDPNGLVTMFLKNLAGDNGKTYTGTMNGLALPNGVSSVTLNADGSVTVTYDPDKATANYDAATNTNLIQLVLPLTVDSNGKFAVDSSDSTGKTPLTNLTLKMNMTADVTVAYQAAAGGADTTVGSTNVKYAAAGTNLQPKFTEVASVLGSKYTVSVPATIQTSDTNNYQGATYKLINNTATNDPTAVELTGIQTKFGDNDRTYLYAKTYGTEWKVTQNAPTLTDTAANVANGVSTTIDLGSAAKGFDAKTLTFAADPMNNGNVIATATLSGTTLTITYQPKTPSDRAQLLNFLQDAYQDGFGLDGWLTDKASDGTIKNALYVKTLTSPLKLVNFTQKATINVSKSGEGYDASAHTYTFDVPENTLSAAELAVLTSTGRLTLTSSSSASDIAKGYTTSNAANWKNISGLTLTLNPNGTAHIVATLAPVATDSNIQNAAILFNGSADGTDTTANGIHLVLTLTNDLTQKSSGLPDSLKPTYTAQTNNAIGGAVTADSPAVAGFKVTGATDQNGVALTITKNADGSASYTSGKTDFGSISGAFKADQITWTYEQAEIDGSLGNQTKVYGSADPSNPYGVTLPSWLTAPKWVSDDFERDNDTSEDAGDHAIKLSAKGIAALQAANTNFTISAKTLSKLTDGKLTITAVGVTATAKSAGRKFNSQSIESNHKDAAGKDYLPTASFTSTGVTPPVNTNLLRDLDFLADTATATNPLADLQFTADEVFWFNDKDASKTPIDLATTSHAGQYDWRLNAKGIQAVKDHIGKNYTMTDAQLAAIGGSYTISQADATGTANSATRAYDGQSFAQNDNNSDGKSFAPTINFDSDSGLTPWTVPAGDYVFKDGSGTIVATTDLKNAGKYTWSLTKDGLKAFYDDLGSRDGTEADTNYTVNAGSVLSGTYEITPVAITIKAPTLSKTYDGNAYTSTDDNGITDTATVTGLPTAGETPAYTLTDISNDKNAGTYTLNVTPTTGATVNDNYTITVVAGSLVISKRPLTTATTNTPTNPANPTAPEKNTPAKTTPQSQTSLTIIGQSKVYDNNAGTDPVKFTVQAPSNYKDFVIPTLTAADFDVSGITSQNVGRYIVKLNATGLKAIQDLNKNYAVTADDIQNALYVITPRPVKITATDASKNYGDSDPVLGATISGVTGNADSGLVKGDKLDYTVARDKGETPGNYQITVTNGKGNANANYLITDETGTLSVLTGITIKYVDQNGNEVSGLPAKQVSGQKVQSTVSIKHPTVDNYLVDDNQPTTYTVTTGTSQVVIVKYRQQTSVTVHYYVKGTTTKVADDSTVTGGVGTSYTSQAQTLTGYTLVDTPANATGTLAASNNDVDYYYTTNYTAVPVDKNGNKIPNAPTPTGTGTPGNPISPKGGLPQIPGYTLTTTPNVPDKPGNVNVVYTPQTETVEVNYYIQGTTTPVTNSITLSGPFGSNYQSTPATVSGYKLVVTPANASGTYGITNGAVNYYYELIVTVVPKTPDGKPVPGTTPSQQPGIPGQTISNVPQIPGYKVTLVPKVPGQPGTVEVIYTPIATPGQASQQPVRTPTVTPEVKQPISSQTILTPAHATTPVSTRLIQQTTATQQATVKKVPAQRASEGHATAHATATHQAKVLPHTGERSSFALVVAGLSMIAIGFIFLGVRKYHRS